MFGLSFETQGNQTFRRDIPGLCPLYPRVPEKPEKKKLVFNSRPLQSFQELGCRGPAIGVIWGIRA